MLDADGKEIQRTEERTFSAGRLDSKDIEVFRDDLCQLLLDTLGNASPFAIQSRSNPSLKRYAASR